MHPLLISAGIGLGLGYLIKILRNQKMKYEIDFLPVGNGDSSGDAIAIRYAEENTEDYKIMVIDGGTKESGQKLVEHITKYYNTNYVDYVVNTHSDQDHASGLSIVLEKLTVGELWIHRPWNYVGEIIHHFKDQRMTEISLERRLKEKFSYAYQLEEIAINKNIPIYEPYQGENIGEFVVMSPSKEWYLHTLLPQSTKTPETKTDSAQNLFKKFSNAVLNIFEDFQIETLKDGGKTSADNESSVVLYTEFNNKDVLLTGDAGTQALNNAVDYYDNEHYLEYSNIYDNLIFIQIPHHGSRNNVSPDTLNKLLGNKGQTQNKTAFVSVGKESNKHPRKVVVNAFIRRGCKVCATQGSSISYKHNMPNRSGWEDVIPLEFASKVESYD
jgi:beta-lactamase superfamily II metal-dependent hydrolase